MKFVFYCLIGFTWGFAASAADCFLKISATQPGVTNPVCVRAIIKKSDGSYVSGEWATPSWPPVTIRGKAMCSDTVIQIPTGTTQITVGKGPDYLPQTITTNLTSANQTYTVSLTLQPALDLFGKGWRSGDGHVHFYHGENEVSRTPQQAFAICAVGGLNFASFAQEHYGATTLTRQQMLAAWEPYANSECKLWLGVEEPKNVWGHHVGIVYDPWAIRSALPYSSGIHSMHEQGGVCYPVHPERMFPGRQANGQYILFPLNNHLKSFPLTALTGHLLDGWSSVSDEAAHPVVLPAYVKLLSMGYKIPLLADSDFCMDRVNNAERAMGFWMNYFHLDGQPLTQASLSSAMRSGRVMSTTGPLVLFTIDGAMPGSSLPANGATRTARIEASYRFNPWTLSSSNFSGTEPCRITQIDLFRNGQIFRSWTPNTSTALVQTAITETTNNSYYFVRVLGNEGVWMAGYASPIFFENAQRPRQPPVFKPLIKGRLYDAKSGLSLTGTVSSVRYGKTEWTVPTDGQGRFRVRLPIDGELIARDASGREFARNIFNYEPAYSFCTYLPEQNSDKAAAVESFRTLVQEMKWEFPIGLQQAASYVRTNLVADGALSNLQIVSAPSPFSGKQTSEIVMLLVDKTCVQVGDTINYAVIFRQPKNQTPSEEFSIEWKGWDPNYPRMYTKYGKTFQYNSGTSGHINLGNGFYARSGSVVVPSWVGNATPSTGAIRMFVTVRGSSWEDASLLIPVGTTKRELLVSSTWDGFPAAWNESGVDPCNFYREGSFAARYADYRGATVRVSINGQQITINPKNDTAHVADADNAIFSDPFYYDGQCEPQYRNIPFRDPIRTQPAEPNYDAVPLQDPADTTPPTVAIMEPFQNAQVSSPVRFYYFIDDEGLSGAASATLFVDGAPIVNTTTNPIVLPINPGAHTWRIEGRDVAGNVASSVVRNFTVTGNAVTNAIVLTSSRWVTTNHFEFRFNSTAGQNYTVLASTSLSNFFPLFVTNASTNTVLVSDSSATNGQRFFRVRQGP